MNNNYKILDRRKRQLSIYFAFFVIFSIITVYLSFVISTYCTDNINIKKRVDKKEMAIIKILKDKTIFNTKNKSTLKLIEKTLKDTTIIKNNRKILGDIDITIIDNKTLFIETNNYKIYIYRNIEINNDNYIIIIKEYSEFTLIKIMKSSLYFILFTLPFLIIFYFVGKIFIGKNFKPIYEIITGLEDFNANVNHELKTPLAEIISTLSLSQKLKTGYDKAIQDSLNSAYKLKNIMNKMSGILSLVDTGLSKEKINIKDLINSIINSQEKSFISKNIKIKKKFLGNFYKVINKEHFDICFGNLLKNAIKYSYNNSNINIIYNNGIISIEDYGVGIAKENIDKIFERYFRESYTNQEGNGLGLSLVKKIIEKNNWDIDIKSIENKGTIITLNIN